MIYKLTPANTQEIIAPDGEIVDIPVATNTSIKIHGPLLPVNISLPTAVLEQHLTHTKQPQTISCDALVDTGASVSAISSKIAEQLGLVVTGFKNIASVHSSEVCPVYFGRITFPWGSGMEIPLISCELQGLECLIGRDVLRYWHMTYDGFNGEITICD